MSLTNEVKILPNATPTTMPTATSTTCPRIANFFKHIYSHGSSPYCCRNTSRFAATMGVMRIRALLLAAPLLFTTVSEARPPNIVYIMADDLGYGHLKDYGGTKIETPNIDRLAAEGMRFTQAYAGSTVCAPSRSVLMTGLHGGHTPVRGNLGDAHISDEDVTIAEVLKRAGYATGGYGKWGLGLQDSPGNPLRQGFDDFLGYLHQVHAHFFYPYWLTFNYGQMMLPWNEGGKRGQYSHDALIERARYFIRKNKDQPFFCYLPVTIPHVELAVPNESLEQYFGRWQEIPGSQEKRVGYIVSPTPKATYAAMVSHLDRDVGGLMALLEELELANDTVAIFNSDNGAQSAYDVNEVFFEASGPLRGFKGSMYEGGLRVPQIVRWPGKVEAGTVTDHITYFPDMMPTLAEIAEVGELPKTDGISFVPELTGKAQAQHEWLYWELIGGAERAIVRRGARKGRWKLVQNDMSKPLEVFDLRTDLGETTDLAARNPEIVEEFETWFKANRTEPRTQPARSAVSYRDYVR